MKLWSTLRQSPVKSPRTKVNIPAFLIGLQSANKSRNKVGTKHKPDTQKIIQIHAKCDIHCVFHDPVQPRYPRAGISNDLCIMMDYQSRILEDRELADGLIRCPGLLESSQSLSWS